MIKNTPSIKEEKVDINRAQLEHRATWMGLIDEAVKAGLDAETVLRKAIKRCGNIHGDGFKDNCANPDSCVDFKNAFLNEVGIKTFEMDGIDVGEDDLKIEFHYCPLVNAWKKLEFDDKTCELLCDVAMDGDRGIAEAMGLKLDLTDTIAKGCSTCKLHFHK